MSKLSERITIFTGNIGSGKTELAINYALRLKQEHDRVGIVDLDIVNPYFRTRVFRDYLEQNGLKVVAPAGELAGADVPALPAAILGILEDEGIKGVFDVGGDDIGATALGRFKPLLPEGSYGMFFVVNTCRPFTRTVEGIMQVLKAVEKASRLKVTGLVSNTNLGSGTDIATIETGHNIVTEAASRLNVPVTFMAVRNELAAELAQRFPQENLFPLNLHVLPPWLRG
ncbi:hypothetical protein [Desulfotruncus alcoholivorax]|uniref:hypothetical protein n=1 Tax=Desulfotruncus alcoholivorax TaxID=265477 RepID=UPI00040E3413|nr:hypothetical protein [Desulfotruncus alcoholivorax]